MVRPLRVSYLALSERYKEHHAGYTHAFSIAQHLRKKGVSLTLYFKGDSLQHFRTGSLPISTLVLPHSHRLFSFLSFIRSYRFLRRETKHADLIHERFHVNPIDLLFIHDKKYMLEVNDPAFVLYFGLKGKVYSYLTRKKLQRCDAVITQTETLKKILQHYTHKPIFVIPNGVDTHLFSPHLNGISVRKKYHLSQTQKVVGFLGSFNLWHGVQDILLFAKALPDVTFFCIGDGPLFNEVREHTREQKNIILAGAQPHERIPSYLAACDLFIAPFNPARFPSLERFGFWWCPVKLFEYMAMGKPTVSYDYLEINTILKGAGVLVAPGDHAAFIAALRILLAKKTMRDALGKKAVLRARESTWEQRAADTLAAYEQILR